MCVCVCVWCENLNFMYISNYVEARNCDGARLSKCVYSLTSVLHLPINSIKQGFPYRISSDALGQESSIF